MSLRVKSRTTITTAAVSLVALAALAACGSGSSSSPAGKSTGSSPPIEIGILLPQTGVNGPTGKFISEGAIVAIKALNAAGGVDGHQLSYKLYDTLGTPQAGVNAFNSFVSDGGKLGLIGYSSVVAAVGPLASRKGVFLLNSGAPPSSAQEGGTHMVATLNGVSHEMTCAANYAYSKLGAKRAAFVYADVGANNQGVHQFGKVFEGLGGSVAGYESEQAGKTTDFRSILTQLLSKQPDLLYLYTYGPDPANIAKQARQLGFKGQIMGYSGIVTPSYQSVGGASTNGTVATTGYFDAASTDKATQDFIAAWKKYSDPNVNPATGLDFYHATLYDGMMMLATAMKYVAAHGGSMTDTSAVQQAFYKIGTFKNLVTGTATYAPSNPIPTKPYGIVKSQDANWAFQGAFGC